MTAPPPNLPSIALEHRRRKMRDAGLTSREIEVLEGMADGLTNTQIGNGLFLGEHTIKTHARRLFRKMGATGRAHAVAEGFRKGWLA